MDHSLTPVFQIDYGEAIEEEIHSLRAAIVKSSNIPMNFDPRWLAVKLLEGEADFVARIAALEGGESIAQQAESARARLAEIAPMGVEIELADRRYQTVGRIVEAALKVPTAPQKTTQERLDRWLTDPIVGVPVFFLIMYFMFRLVVDVSAPYLAWIEAVVGGPIVRWVGSLLDVFALPNWIRGLVLDGLIPGVGGVLVFIPGLAVLFLFIAVLEESGYLARAAVVMDRFMRGIGLHGKSFVPLILGFGCAVPAIYATRTLEERRSRILTGLLVPFMSCAARLPVYVLFGLAFFGANADFVIWGLYGFGILIAILVGVVLSRTLFRRQSNQGAFLIELPAYHVPSLKSLREHVLHRVGEFIQNAGTVILLASAAIWFLLYMPPGSTDLQESWFGRVSAAVAPLFEPAGFGTWEATGALVSGLVAKEVVVSTMSEIYLGEDLPESVETSSTWLEDMVWILNGFWEATVRSLQTLLDVLTPGITLFPTEETSTAGSPGLGLRLQTVFSPLSALAFMVFVLLYIPCFATLGAMRAEFGGRWALFSAITQLALAWAMAVLIFQGGKLLGFA